MDLRPGLRLSLSGLALLGLAATGGCATLPGPPDPQDPWEGYNRRVFSLNQHLDGAIVKPLAEIYQMVLPSPVDRGISNFFNNLNDVVVIANDVAQLKLEQAVADLGRLVMNTTFGIGGVFDVATPYGLEKHDEDFGQTLGYWGLDPGPYLVLPLLGPSNVRDTVGLAGDIYVSPIFGDDVALRNTMVAVRFIDLRADLLSATRIVETAALDEYVFVRDAYLQRRRYQVYDGNPPPVPLEEDFDEASPPASDAEPDASPS
jgi:phospholipid-binding lipoprotein MlaA